MFKVFYLVLKCGCIHKSTFFELFSFRKYYFWQNLDLLKLFKDYISFDKHFYFNKKPINFRNNFFLQNRNMLSSNMTSNYCYWLGFERSRGNNFARVSDGHQVDGFEKWAKRYSPADHPRWNHLSVFYRPSDTHHADLYMMPPYSVCHFVCEPK